MFTLCSVRIKRHKGVHNRTSGSDLSKRHHEVNNDTISSVSHSDTRRFNMKLKV